MACQHILLAVFVVFTIAAAVWIVKAELKANYYREQHRQCFEALQNM